MKVVDRTASTCHSFVSPALKTIEDSAVVAKVRKTSLAVVDAVDVLIDRYLPDPCISDEDGEKPCLGDEEGEQRCIQDLEVDRPCVKNEELSFEFKQSFCKLLRVHVLSSQCRSLDLDPEEIDMRVLGGSAELGNWDATVAPKMKLISKDKDGLTFGVIIDTMSSMDFKYAILGKSVHWENSIENRSLGDGLVDVIHKFDSIDEGKEVPSVPAESLETLMVLTESNDLIPDATECHQRFSVDSNQSTMVPIGQAPSLSSLATVAALSSPKVFDRITCMGYGYISPPLDWACKAMPLLGGVKESIEPYFSQAIQKADTCVDTAYAAVKERALAFRAAETGEKPEEMNRRSLVVSHMRKTGLVIFDAVDMLIDRFLLDSQAKEGAAQATDTSETKYGAPDTVGA